MSVGTFDDDTPQVTTMKDFIKQVWRAFQKITDNRVQCVSLETGEVLNAHVPYFREGADARQWCITESGRHFHDNGVNYYRPKAIA
jgi:hypothetical protein